ncbi:hypothetical protein HYALB_00002629 [Hymenoscyphus albidus]|uniref:beta-glucosidase n=1 Tax=Hymenoscyphus albidus TaxID=595503 RepID=A0A9N9LWG6_9HELO|nr:hypothetical protein HYALB_00002629 [Hymenoscyphus albidus]
MYKLNTLFFLVLTGLDLVGGLKRKGPRTPLPAENWAAASEKAKAFVSQLDVTEKASMVTGSPGACIGNIAPMPRLNFSGICFTDGPHAVSRMEIVSVFPASLTMAATWDKDLLYERGYALGEEFREKGSHVGLGPSAGPLGRHPLGGRNWEGFSPDPYLSGVAMRETILGTQDAGTQTTSRHIIGNEQETQRTNSFLEDGIEVHALSSNIDDRTMHELYMWPFADAVKAGTTSVMCAFNRVNQTYSCEDDQLLNHILKKELGFEGYFFSDKNLISGLISPITSKSGNITMSRLDDMIQRIMTPYYLLNQDHSDYPSLDPSAICILGASLTGEISCSIAARDVRGNHSSLIRRMGSDGTVLLKNVNNALPLKSPKSIAAFGNDAGDLMSGLT